MLVGGQEISAIRLKPQSPGRIHGIGIIRCEILTEIFARDKRNKHQTEQTKIGRKRIPADEINSPILQQRQYVNIHDQPMLSTTDKDAGQRWHITVVAAPGQSDMIG